VIHLVNPDDAALRQAVQSLLEGVKSVADIARRMKKSRGTLYKWQSGKSAPNIIELCTLANLLERPVRIDIGNEDQFEAQEDLTVMIGRVLNNQQRQLKALSDITVRVGALAVAAGVVD
jgi:transcriptional regulator with XRE-family HTH domain